jgi:DNA-binding Xre family transcriptional regulator
MTEPEPTVQGRAWRRFGQGTFEFDVPEMGRMLRLTSTRHEDGHVHADVRGFVTSGPNPKLFITRPKVNLTSDLSMDRLTKSLQGASPFEGAVWRDTLERICAVLVDQMSQRGVVTRMRRMVGAELAQPYLFDNFMPANLITGLVAHGGTGKSLVAGMLALATATGIEVGGFKSNEVGPVLYLDWENGTHKAEEVHSRRLTRMCDALHIDFPENIIHYAATANLAKCESQIVELSIREGVVLTVLDSMSYAAGGNLNDTDVAANATNVLKAIPRSKLMIAHVPKSNLDEDHPTRNGPIGSVTFWNGPQAVYELGASGDWNGSGLVTYTLDRQKGNVMPALKRPIGLTAHFEDPQGPITWNSIEIQGDSEAGRHLGMALRIHDYLSHRGPSLEQHILYEMDALTGLAKERVVKVLRNMLRQHRVTYTEAGHHWALPAGEAPTNDMGPCARCSEPANSFDDTGRPVCTWHNPDIE